MLGLAQAVKSIHFNTAATAWRLIAANAKSTSSFDGVSFSVMGMVPMNGVRIYINSGVVGTPGSEGVFYSRRAGGPYYRWYYETAVGQWRFIRMHSINFSPQGLCSWQWKQVPAALQGRLKDHYQE